MNVNNNNKKILAEKIKAKLNSPDYVAMPDLITHDNRYGKILTFLWGNKIDGNIHKKENWISGMDINPGKGNKHESEHMVCYDELEKDDWEEIVNLIEKRNKEKDQIFETKEKNIEQKLNQQSNLYYYWGAGWRKRERNENADVWVEDKGMRGFTTLLGGQGNGLTYHLYISEDHPVLNNFPFQTGYYLIETNQPTEKRTGRYNGFNSTGGESNPFNWTKFVEVGDQITITPYEVAADKPVEKPTKKSGSKTNNNLMAAAGSENKDSHKNTEKAVNEVEKNKIIEWIIQYFKDNQIKKISLEDGKLVITHNNNNSNNSDNQLIKNSLQKLNKNELTSQELGLSSNNNFTPTQNPNNGKTWLIGGSIILVTFGIVVGILLSKKKKKR